MALTSLPILKYNTARSEMTAKPGYFEQPNPGYFEQPNPGYFEQPKPVT